MKNTRWAGNRFNIEEVNKGNLFKELFCVVADEDFEEEIEEMEDVLAAKPSSLLVKMAIAVLNHFKEVEEINVCFISNKASIGI